MKPTTVYSDLWYQVIARPRYDKRLADQLRRAHNRAVMKRINGEKATDVPVSFDEEVTALSQGKATAKRTIIEPLSSFNHAELRS